MPIFVVKHLDPPLVIREDYMNLGDYTVGELYKAPTGQWYFESVENVFFSSEDLRAIARELDSLAAENNPQQMEMFDEAGAVLESAKYDDT